MLSKQIILHGCSANHRCTIFSYVKLILERLLYKSWAQFVYASHEQWKLEPSTPRVSQWSGMVYHHRASTTMMYQRDLDDNVPHCSLPHHCVMMFPFPNTMERGWALSICVPPLQCWPSVAAFFGITNIIRWGPFISSPFLLYFVKRIPGLCKWWLVLYTKEVVQKQRTLISVDAQRLPTRAQCGGIARG